MCSLIFTQIKANTCICELFLINFVHTLHVISRRQAYHPILTRGSFCLGSLLVIMRILLGVLLLQLHLATIIALTVRAYHTESLNHLPMGEEVNWLLTEEGGHFFLGDLTFHLKVHPANAHTINYFGTLVPSQSHNWPYTTKLTIALAQSLGNWLQRGFSPEYSYKGTKMPMIHLYRGLGSSEQQGSLLSRRNTSCVVNGIPGFPCDE